MSLFSLGKTLEVFPEHPPTPPSNDRGGVQLIQVHGQLKVYDYERPPLMKGHISFAVGD